MQVIFHSLFLPTAERITVSKSTMNIFHYTAVSNSEFKQQDKVLEKQRGKYFPDKYWK